MNRPIDHIVYTVFDLDKAMDNFETLLGVRPVFGGYHKTFGTKNALINLNDGMYLELLAADHDNTAVKRPRWMAVDTLQKEQLTRWALKSEKIESDSRALKEFNTEMGHIEKGSRTTSDGSVLQWRLTKPLPHPEVELVPFVLDWSSSEIHPHDSLPEMGCQLVKLYGTHPKPERFSNIFMALDTEISIEKDSKIRLKMTVQSPNGLVTF